MKHDVEHVATLVAAGLTFASFDNFVDLLADVSFVFVMLPSAFPHEQLFVPWEYISSPVCVP
ncbi:hypothetical protein A9W96_22840 [Mycobacterium sp. 1245852.3]|nr:hypothetical protein A9W96_22840 [Mycobacterium sp. 1245852.3]